MAAATALNVVKQIQALAEGPQNAKMRECLPQVASSLLFFLDHPDSRVRTGAARTLVKLSKSYAGDMQCLDLERARSAQARSRKAESDGTADADSNELMQLLDELLGEVDSAGASSTGAKPTLAGSSGGAQPTPTDCSGNGAAAAEDRGEVILKVAEEADGKLKAAILEKVVVLAGVVSVTFEGSYVIVAAKTPAVAADAGFLADLLQAVKAQGLQGVSLVSAAAAGTAAGDAHGPAAGPTPASGCGAPLGASSSTALQDDDIDDEGEPAYLDDDEDEVIGSVGAEREAMPIGGLGGPLGGGAAQWSFFAQSNWMTGRRVQEFDDDPTIAARLAKAKKREEERKEEEQSRLGRLSSWFMGGR